MSNPIRFPLNHQAPHDKLRFIENTAPGSWRIAETKRPGEWICVRDLNRYENALVNGAYVYAHGRAHNAAKASIDALVKQLADANRSAAMYANAWQRKLAAYDGTIRNKRHHIDAMVVTTRDLVGKLKQTEARLAELDAEITGIEQGLARVTTEAAKRYDVGPYELGLANGLLLALATLRGGTFAPIPSPAVWRDEQRTLRGRFKAWRQKGEGRLASACLAALDARVTP